MTLFALHWSMRDETSEVLVFVHWSPLLSTRRMVLAPLAAMSAMELVSSGYQVYAWLTPRITNSFPLASYTRPLLTWMPVAAASAGPHGEAEDGDQQAEDGGERRAG